MVIKVVVKIIPQQAINQNALAFKIIMKGSMLEPGVQKSTNTSKLINSFVAQSVVKITSTYKKFKPTFNLKFTFLGLFGLPAT